MLLAFFTADIVDGEVVKDLKSIALLYFKGWFFVDVLGAFPYSVVWISSSDVLKFLRLLRILKMGAMERRLVRSWDLNLDVQTQIKLFKVSLHRTALLSLYFLKFDCLFRWYFLF